MLSTTEEELLAIPDIGEIASHHILEAIHDGRIKNTWERLSQIGLKLQVNTQTTDGPLSGMTFLFTGKLSQFNRDSAKAEAQKRGAKTADQINKNVSHLVAGEKAGSKIKKAQQLQITILSEQEFIELLETSN